MSRSLGLACAYLLDLENGCRTESPAAFLYGEKSKKFPKALDKSRKLEYTNYRKLAKANPRKKETRGSAQEGGGMMPLTMAGIGEPVVIRKITGKDQVRQHLAELGFVVDGTVTVISRLAGNLILQVKDSRIALDSTMANRIMI